MIRIPALAVLLAGLAAAAASADLASPNKVPSTRDLGSLRRQVETLRGKNFLHDVPVYTISEDELRAISDRELDKEFPGRKLQSYEELLAWLDIIPPETELKPVYAEFFAKQVAGLYDSDAKQMCIPAFPSGMTNVAKKAADKKLEALSPWLDNIVLAHEFTHALEDQHWPIDDPKDDDPKDSTDRGVAHGFLIEGSATREMIELIPAQWARGSAGHYFLVWTLIHSEMGESMFKHALKGVWKSPDALAPGVPDALSRVESMPYSYGYAYCADLMRQWGLDGLDYIYDHRPVSSEQLMHPSKSWQWRDFPVQVNLPETLPGDWKQTCTDSVGEAGIAVLFGCQFKNLNRGLEIAHGWDGDQVALFEGPGSQRILLWASSWDSSTAAARYASAWAKQRQAAHKALITQTSPSQIDWKSPDGRSGFIRRYGKRVIIVETDAREALPGVDANLGALTFEEPAQDAIRAQANSVVARFNPLWSWQKDGDYAINRSLWGLLSRHDRNTVGTADRFLLGLLGEWRRTSSFNKWQLGRGSVVRHESEARRGTSKTTWLPWGVLATHSSAKVPDLPEVTIARTSLLWGLGATATSDEGGEHAVHVLPFGLLLRSTSGPGQSSLHVLGTGLSRKEAVNQSASTAQFRLLGIPLWTTHTPASGQVAQR